MIKEKTGYANITIRSYIEPDGHEIPDIINEAASEMNADLIVALKENRHFLDRIFKASSTRKIIEHAKLPVLVYHEKPE